MKLYIALIVILIVILGFIGNRLIAESKLQHCIVTICKGLTDDSKCREMDTYTPKGEKFTEVKFPKGYIPFNARCLDD